MDEKKEKPFLSDVKSLRARARQHMEQGAITDGYKGDIKVTLDVLNEALATEIVCVLRYKRHYYAAKGIHSLEVAAEFQEHAAAEQLHVDMIAERIVQLGGEPDFSPEGLATRSETEYVPGRDLTEMIQEDLVAERIVIDSYREMIAYFGDKDPTTRRMIEGLLADEEEHAEDLASLLQRKPS